MWKEECETLFTVVWRKQLYSLNNIHLVAINVAQLLYHDLLKVWTCSVRPQWRRPGDQLTTIWQLHMRKTCPRLLRVVVKLWKVPHKPEMDNLCRPTKGFALYSWLAEAVRLNFYFEGKCPVFSLCIASFALAGAVFGDNLASSMQTTVAVCSHLKQSQGSFWCSTICVINFTQILPATTRHLVGKYPHFTGRFPEVDRSLGWCDWGLSVRTCRLWSSLQIYTPAVISLRSHAWFIATKTREHMEKTAVPSILGCSFRLCGFFWCYLRYSGVDCTHIADWIRWLCCLRLACRLRCLWANVSEHYWCCYV